MDDPSEAYGPNRQREVYASGTLADVRPDLPTSPDELREEAMLRGWVVFELCVSKVDARRSTRHSWFWHGGTATVRKR